MTWWQRLFGGGKTVPDEPVPDWISETETSEVIPRIVGATDAVEAIRVDIGHVVEAVPVLVAKLWSLPGLMGRNGLTRICYDGYLKIQVSPEIETEAQTMAVIAACDVLSRHKGHIRFEDIDLIIGAICGSMSRSRKSTELLRAFGDLRKWLAALPGSMKDSPAFWKEKAEKWNSKINDKMRTIQT